MTGERWAWFRLAFHLKIPVAELQSKIGYSEFLEWQVYLETIDKDKARQEYALAQIAAEACRARLLHPGKVKTEDFLIRFKDDGTVKMTKEERMARSKAAWLSMAGIKRK